MQIVSPGQATYFSEVTVFSWSDSGLYRLDHSDLACGAGRQCGRDYGLADAGSGAGDDQPHDIAVGASRSRWRQQPTGASGVGWPGAGVDGRRNAHADSSDVLIGADIRRHRVHKVSERPEPHPFSYCGSGSPGNIHRAVQLNDSDRAEHAYVRDAPLAGQPDEAFAWPGLDPFDLTLPVMAAEESDASARDCCRRRVSYEGRPVH